MPGLPVYFHLLVVLLVTLSPCLYCAYALLRKYACPPDTTSYKRMSEADDYTYPARTGGSPDSVRHPLQA